MSAPDQNSRAAKPIVYGGASADTPMRVALAAARDAAALGEVPVGAVVLSADNVILAVAGNEVEARCDPSAHAELVAMRRAARTRGGRLTGCTVVVTLEPCLMCASAIVHFRPNRVVFGAYDPKGGGIEHGPRIFAQPHCVHRPETIGGVCESEAASLLRTFFLSRR